MKLLDEIHAYQGTRKIPLLEFKKEKNHLLQLPTERVRDSYRIRHKLVKVNASNMISYKSNQYSVPPGYQGTKVGIQVYDNQLWIYYNMELIAQHKISEAKLNYQ